MTLFLTSSPCDNNVPEGLDLPCIFDARNGFVENLRASVEPGAQLLIIASDPDAFAGNDEMAATFEGCFAAAEIELEDVCVLDRRNAGDAAELVAQSGVILLSGGHVPTENAFFASMDLRNLLADFDGVIIGISAGSMNCADVVYAQPEEPGEAVDPDYQRFIPGLGLTTRNILPHYNQVKDNVLDGLRLFEDITAADSTGHSARRQLYPFARWRRNAVRRSMADAQRRAGKADGGRRRVGIINRKHCGAPLQTGGCAVCVYSIFSRINPFPYASVSASKSSISVRLRCPSSVSPIRIRRGAV